MGLRLVHEAAIKIEGLIRPEDEAWRAAGDPDSFQLRQGVSHVPRADPVLHQGMFRQGFIHSRRNGGELDPRRPQHRLAGGAG